MVNTTQTKVNQIIGKLHRGKHIDYMTKNGFLKPPARLELLSSTRLQKSTNLFRSEDRSSLVATAHCCGFATTYHTKTTILHKGYN